MITATVNKNRRLLANTSLALLALALAFFAVSCGSHSDESKVAEKTLYTCGMHPQVIQDHPGNCPICGMKLTPIRNQAAGATNVAATTTTATATIAIDPVTMQNMGFRSDVVRRGPLRRAIRTVAVVDYDETALHEVTTKFKGWIEKLDVDATGKQVHRGEPLFEIYSPELYSAQVEFLLALGSSTNAPASGEALKTSARAKLKFFDISDEQIADLEKTREARRTLRVSSPADGFVVEKMVVQGQMVESGMKLYRIADIGLVWVFAQIYEKDLPFVKLGQEATVGLSYLPDRKFRGRVTFIYPTVDERTRTARVRLEFHNPGFFLKPGMFATAEMEAELAPDVLLVPDMAVLRSGEKNTVFVALDGGKFEPRTITLGPRAEHDTYQVLSGLSEGERVVTSGQFMLDSESQLREAIQKMLNPNAHDSGQGRAGSPLPATSAVKSEDGAHGVTRPTSGPASAPPTNAPTAAYICPMPEHVSIRYDHPGKCPLCGMILVPVTAETLAKLQPGGHVQYYACPMTENCPTPGHGVVKHDKPGKCPVCGMTLIPVMETPKPTPTESTKPAETTAQLYTCPMPEDADVVSDKPGDCSKCGMKLVETSKVAHGKIAEENWRKQRAASAPQHQH
ncbi:MAG: efflux RND transporter periplasmic adaptor subunit [Verrucomicrobia bacterium]|jgi:RND family efflux transporter MFP subunit|nr:efflux RND transporter periplasmic adaptor subunit [Verrucomicrobiota bacterium]